MIVPTLSRGHETVTNSGHALRSHWRRSLTLPNARKAPVFRDVELQPLGKVRPRGIHGASAAAAQVRCWWRPERWLEAPK